MIIQKNIKSEKVYRIRDQLSQKERIKPPQKEKNKA